MKFKIAYCTDIGRTKKVNQDSIGYREIEIGENKYILMMVCDGMGGTAECPGGLWGGILAP